MNNYENDYQNLDYTKPNKKKFAKIFNIIAYFAVFAIGYQSAVISFNSKYGNVPLETIGDINNIENIIDEYYYQEYDKAKLYDFLKSAMIYGLEDPYSYYLSEDETEEFNENISGNYVGIGVTLSPNENGEISVVAPFDGSPAQKAGIMPGDVIVKVNDNPYSYDDIDTAVSLMKGHEGEKVKLEIKRQNSENLFFEITKSKIEIDSVYAKSISDNIVYLRISRFDITTYEDFLSKLGSFNISPDTNLILDLRDNPGGVVESATNIADIFLEEGIIITEKYRNKKDVVAEAKEGSANLKYPIVILINKNTASASEILTGALKDHEKAYLIGEKTYGKGLLNQKFKFNSKDSVVISIAQYTTPKGTNIHKVGIEPHLNVPMQYNKSIQSLTLEEDIQLQKAIEYISSQKN